MPAEIVFVLLQYYHWVKPEAFQGPGSYVIPVNFGIFALGNIYQAVLAFDALRLKNNLQLWGICALNACSFVFGIMRVRQTQRTASNLALSEALGNRPLVDRSVNYWRQIQPVLWASASIVGICSLVSSVLAFLLQREFRWVIYRHISGSLEMLRRYLAYQVLLVLLRLEIFFLVGFIILFGFIKVHFVEPEFGLTIAIFPAMVIQIACTVLSTKAENYLGAIVAIILRLGEMAYLASRVVLLSGGGTMSHTLLQDEMLLFAAAALALSSLTCLNAMLCTFNFGKGLKPLLQNTSWKQRPHEFEPVHQHRYAERIELD